MSATTSSATLASAAALNVPGGLPTDLLILLRPQPANGQPTEYAPQNITATAWLASLLPVAIAAMMQTLPTTDGSSSPLWLNDGVLTLTTGTATGSGVPLTVTAFMSSFKAAMATLPGADPKDGVSPWLDDSLLARATKPMPAGS